MFATPKIKTPSQKTQIPSTEQKHLYLTSALTSNKFKGQNTVSSCKPFALKRYIKVEDVCHTENETSS